MLKIVITTETLNTDNIAAYLRKIATNIESGNLRRKKITITGFDDEPIGYYQITKD